MNRNQVKDDRQTAGVHAREAWGEPTDDDLNRVGGNRAKLVERLQERYGINKNEAERRVERLLRDEEGET